jgi:hypothetical protein
MFDRSFRAAACDTDHYLVEVNVRERLAVIRHRSHRFHMERFNPKTLKRTGLAWLRIGTCGELLCIKCWETIE